MIPPAVETRWRPVRLGLLNLFRYDDEVFRFADGRLLLRGNNGTGKTRVLALTLPFLLDGETRSARVEPDGDPNRRFEWHLLQDRYPERTGYCWLEFQRRDAEGALRTCTLGCGMRAVQGHTGLRNRWFFVTTRRVGEGFRLKRADGTPWTRDELLASLAGDGTVYEQAVDYRRAVDEVLFGLGEQRYRSLVDLLIELRRPQLSRQLDEPRLTRALSEALPPIEAAVIDEVAENFQGLERERDELVAARVGLQAVEDFLAVFRDYLAYKARLLGDAVRREHARFEQTGRDLAAAEARLASAEAAVGDAEQTLAAVQAQLAQAAAEERALRASEAMRSAEQLDRLREQAAHAEATARADETDAAAASALLAACAQRVAKTQVMVAAAEAALASRRELLLESASALGAGSLVAAALDRAETGDHDRLQADLAERRRSAAHLHRLDAACRRCAEAVAQATSRLQAAEAACARREVEAVGAAEEWTAQQAAHRQAVQAHLAACRELPVDRDDLDERLAAWLQEPEEADPLQAVLGVSAAVRREEIAATAGRLQQEDRALAAEDVRLVTEAAALEQGQDPLPAAPPWRSPDARHGRAGAPFWALCDFVPGLSEAERAGLEGALLASQVLDAWVAPDGSLRSGADGDVLLLPQGPRPERSLREWLVATPPADSGSTVAQVEELLARIGTGPGAGPAWVGTDGRWALGPLGGRHAVERARHLGAASRAAARAERLALIATRRQELAAQRRTLADALQQGEAALAQIRRELATPDVDGVRRAWRRVRVAQDQVLAAQEDLAQAQVARGSARSAEEAARRALQEGADELGLRAWCERLGELDRQLDDYRLALSEWWHATASWRRETVQAARDEADHRDQEARSGAARERANASAAHAASGQRELQVLEETRGSAVAELLARLDELRRTREEQEQVQRRAHEAIAAACEERGVAQGAVTETTARRTEADEQRQIALAQLREVAASGLLAGLGEDWRAPIPTAAADTRVVELARKLARDYAAVAVDGRAADALGTRMAQANQQLQSELSVQNYQVRIAERHGITEVRVPHGGQDRDVAELATVLADDIAQRDLLLTQHEREVIENFLIDEVCEHLHRLLHEAAHWITEVNRELAERPMSTGLALRFVHLVAEDAAPGTAEACDRLLRPQHAWSPSDREALAAYLQQAIAGARESLPGSSWQEQLAVALDYRRWHRIVIERRQDARWQRLTRRSHGTGSGGEKAMALTVPQFAAAAAHYRATPLAPRLIMLDEAFVGIDTDMRRKCMGLLVAFDLDVVLTSEREWGCYDTVPALAIYQIAGEPGGDCLATTCYVWNGRQRVREEPAEGTGKVEDGERHADASADGLPATSGHD